MALGILRLLYIVMLVIVLVIQSLLYKNKDETSNNIFIVNMLFAILLSYLAYTSLPTNFTGQRILAIALGIISVLAVVLKLNTEKNIIVSKVILSISIVGSFLLLFL